jgi:hypothetical protein
MSGHTPLCVRPRYLYRGIPSASGQDGRPADGRCACPAAIRPNFANLLLAPLLPLRLLLALALCDRVRAVKGVGLGDGLAIFANE